MTDTNNATERIAKTELKSRATAMIKKLNAKLINLTWRKASVLSVLHK